MLVCRSQRSRHLVKSKLRRFSSDIVCKRGASLKVGAFTFLGAFLFYFDFLGLHFPLKRQHGAIEAQQRWQMFARGP